LLCFKCVYVVFIAVRMVLPGAEVDGYTGQRERDAARHARKEEVYSAT
jgi:hypothetical protein